MHVFTSEFGYKNSYNKKLARNIVAKYMRDKKEP